MHTAWDGVTRQCFSNLSLRSKGNSFPVKEIHPMHDFAIAATFLMMVFSPVFVTLFYREGEEIGQA